MFIQDEKGLRINTDFAAYWHSTFGLDPDTLTSLINKGLENMSAYDRIDFVGKNCLITYQKPIKSKIWFLICWYLFYKWKINKSQGS